MIIFYLYQLSTFYSQIKINLLVFIIDNQADKPVTNLMIYTFLNYFKMTPIMHHIIVKQNNSKVSYIKNPN